MVFNRVVCITTQCQVEYVVPKRTWKLSYWQKKSTIRNWEEWIVERNEWRVFREIFVWLLANIIIQQHECQGTFQCENKMKNDMILKRLKKDKRNDTERNKMLIQVTISQNWRHCCSRNFVGKFQKVISMPRTEIDVPVIQTWYFIFVSFFLCTCVSLTVHRNWVMAKYKIVLIKKNVLTMKIAADLCWLSVVNATHSRAISNVYVESVAKLRVSKNVSTKGTVPMVQSQHRSHGNNNSQKFTDVK